MALRGPFIGRGYIKHFGMVTVFTDLDDTKMLFVQKIKTDETRYVSRDRVEFRK
jgi:hypothetical protein